MRPVGGHTIAFMNTAKDASEFMVVEEVASKMRTTVWAVRSWIRNGKLAAIRPGKRLLVRRSDVLKLLAAVVVRPGEGSPPVANHGPAGLAGTP
jgi:excisionase family DNA binding protein